MEYKGASGGEPPHPPETRKGLNNFIRGLNLEISFLRNFEKFGKGFSQLCSKTKTDFSRVLGVPRAGPQDPISCKRFCINFSYLAISKRSMPLLSAMYHRCARSDIECSEIVC